MSSSTMMDPMIAREKGEEMNLVDRHRRVKIMQIYVSEGREGWSCNKEVNALWRGSFMTNMDR